MNSAAEALLRQAESADEWKAPRPHVEGVLMSDVKPETIAWLWFGYLPLGKLVVIDGDPGTSKSMLTCGITGVVTSGTRWPDGSPCTAGGAVLLNAEDGLADVVANRLRVAGADLSRVRAIQTIGTGDNVRPVTLPDDLPVVRTAVRDVDARIVVIDPLMAFLGETTNAHRDQDVRRVLSQLAQMAEELRVTIIIVRHLNKASGGPAIYRGGGSIGIIGAARVGYVVAPDPGNEDIRVLAATKCNVARMPRSLAYSIEDVDGAPRVRWIGTTSISATELLSDSLRKDATPREGRILEAMGRDLTHYSDIAIALDMKPDSARKTLNRMADKGLVTWSGRGTYALPAPEGGDIHEFTQSPLSSLSFKSSESSLSPEDEQDTQDAEDIEDK